MNARRLRVLITADAVGGVWQYSLDLARGLSRLGVDTVLAVMGPAATPIQQDDAGEVEGLLLVDTGLPLDWLAADPAVLREAGDGIAALAVRHGVDVVQLHAPALAAQTRFAVPVIAVNHSCLTTWWSAVKGGRPTPPYAWRAEMTGEGLRAADRVVAPTAAFAEATRTAYDLAVTPMAVHNGRSPLPLAKVAPHDFVFTAGRLWDKGKNVATLDRAAAQLDLPFYAAGPDHGLSGDTIRLAHARGLGNLGEAEIARWLAATPIFVSAAVYEPFGLAVLEAAAAGCALVLSDIPTFRELWDGVASFVHPMDDQGFARAIGEIAGDGRLRAARGAAARERAARFTPEAMARQMADIYAGLSGKAHGQKAAA